MYLHTKYSKYYPEWIKLYESGESSSEIAKIYKCDSKNVRRRLKKLGIKIRTRLKRWIENPYKEFVIKKDGCWSWRGSVNNKGYPQFRFNGKFWLAHRYSYLIHRGDFPDKYHILHSCDNPMCSNPDHLFLGTRKDNMMDCLIKGRHKNTKFKANDIREIRGLLLKGKTTTEIAKSFQVKTKVITRIKSGKSFAFIN